MVATGGGDAAAAGAGVTAGCGAGSGGWAVGAAVVGASRALMGGDIPLGLRTAQCRLGFRKWGQTLTSA